MDYSKVRQAARAAFEARFEKTGLNIVDIRRGNYIVSRWGNEGRDIEQTLRMAQLPYYKNLSGAFIVSSDPMEQDAIERVYEANAQASPAKALSFQLKH